MTNSKDLYGTNPIGKFQDFIAENVCYAVLLDKPPRDKTITIRQCPMRSEVDVAAERDILNAVKF